MLRLEFETKSVRRIYTKVQLTNPFKDITGEATSAWDTGATHTVVSEDVVEILELEKIGEMPASSATTDVTAGIYICKITLEDLTELTLPVISAPNLSTDILIGMDLISMGELHIGHNEDGNLFFSFEIP